MFHRVSQRAAPGGGEVAVYDCRLVHTVNSARNVRLWALIEMDIINEKKKKISI